MKAWFDDPQQLVRADRVTQFWPNRDQTPEERINAASRFIIYATCIIYLTRRDPRIFVLGATIISVLLVLHRYRVGIEGYGLKIAGVGGVCQMAAYGNPLVNIWERL